MSEQATATQPTQEHTADAQSAEIPFDRAELKQFGSDDIEAGRNICKMLSLFFAYTVLVMGLSTYITWRWVMGD